MAIDPENTAKAIADQDKEEYSQTHEPDVRTGKRGSKRPVRINLADPVKRDPDDADREEDPSEP